MIELVRSFVFEWTSENKDLKLMKTFVLKAKEGMNVRAKARN
jgi:hypothetical protein